MGPRWVAKEVKGGRAVMGGAEVLTGATAVLMAAETTVVEREVQADWPAAAVATAAGVKGAATEVEVMAL